MTAKLYYPATPELPDNVKANRLVKYQVPRSMPPIIKGIAAGTVFAWDGMLTPADIKALLRQGAVSAADAPAAEVAAQAPQAEEAAEG